MQHGISKMVDYVFIGEKIKKKRKSRNMTQEEIAEAADITIVYLSEIERGKVRPSLEVLDSICTSLDMDLGQLFSDEACEPNNYQDELIAKLFRECAPSVKPVALNVMENLSRLFQ